MLTLSELRVFLGVGDAPERAQCSLSLMTTVSYAHVTLSTLVTKRNR